MRKGWAFSARHIARAVFAIALAYVLVIQSLASATDKNSALQLAQQGLSALCASNDHVPNPDGPDGGHCPDMPCFVPGSRVQSPMAILPAETELLSPERRLVENHNYPVEQASGLACNSELAPLQARAPPANLV